MSFTLSDTQAALRRTLFALTAFEALHIIQLIFLSFFFPKTEAAIYAVIISLTTATSKFIDAGAGVSMARFLRMPEIAPHIGRILLTQFLFIFPLVVMVMILLSGGWECMRTGSPVVVRDDKWVPLILFVAIFEAMASVGRHAVYSTLRSTRLMKTEVGIKAIQVCSLPLLLWSVGISGPVMIAHYAFFLCINSMAVIWLARGLLGTWKIADPGSESGMTDLKVEIIKHLSSRPQSRDPSSSSPLSSRTPIRDLVLHHITVLKQRWQLFSVKIGKDLLSSFVLTPLFAYTYGMEYTWLFYCSTTLISDFQTIIKMGIGYTAAGAFAQLPHHLHATSRRRLNTSLLYLIGIGCSIVAMVYVIATYFPYLICHPGLRSGTHSASSPLHQAILCVTLYALVAFIDIAAVVYEQQFLVSGSYARFQYLRITEYLIIAAIVLGGGKFCNLPTLAAFLILTKISILIIIRSRARGINERT